MKPGRKADALGRASQPRSLGHASAQAHRGVHLQEPATKTGLGSVKPGREFVAAAPHRWVCQWGRPNITLAGSHCRDPRRPGPRLGSKPVPGCRLPAERGCYGTYVRYQPRRRPCVQSVSLAPHAGACMRGFHKNTAEDLVTVRDQLGDSSFFTHSAFPLHAAEPGRVRGRRGVGDEDAVVGPALLSPAAASVPRGWASAIDLVRPSGIHSFSPRGAWLGEGSSRAKAASGAAPLGPGWLAAPLSETEGPAELSLRLRAEIR